MFNLFKWSTTNQSDDQTHQPPPPPPPPPPPLPVTSMTNGEGAKNTAQSLDLMTTLLRIENKLDIILMKIDLSEGKRKKFSIGNDASTNRPAIAKEIAHFTRTQNSQASEGFVAELMKKVEERKIAKHMGASHGFASVMEAIQVNNSDN